jgi:hypothetical protein
MNAKISQRPTLACRAVRGWTALSGGGGAPQTGRIGSGHLEHCAECRAFFAAGDELDRALTREASLSREPLPFGFEHRVMQAIRQAERPSRRAVSPRAIASFAAAAASLALAIFVLPKHEATTNVVQPSGASGTVAMAAAGDSLVSRVWDSLDPKASELIEENSLQTEVDSVASDARSAVNFLAMNFLPSASIDVDAFAARSGG